MLDNPGFSRTSFSREAEPGGVFALLEEQIDLRQRLIYTSIYFMELEGAYV